MSNGLNLQQPKQKMPQFDSLDDEKLFLESQRDQIQIDISKLGLSLAHKPDQTKKASILEKQLKLKQSLTEVVGQIRIVDVKRKKDFTEKQEQRENNIAPLICDLIGIADQILSEIREINRKLLGPIE